MKSKISVFNIFVPAFSHDKILGFNSFTGSFLTFGNDEWSEVKGILENLDSGNDLPNNSMYQRLIEAGMIVDHDLNEREEVVRRYKAKSISKNKGLALTIAPTINCNFGCSYCFQEHEARRMSDDDISGLLEFVERKLELNTSLYVTWFGGEPLLAFGKIKRIYGGLREICDSRNCSYSHSMISNGSLLDEEKIAWFSSQGLEYIQITVDGPPEFHDVRRPFRLGKPSFEKILENIKLVDKRIHITLRVNIDRTNVDGLANLLMIIKDSGLRNKLSIYLGHVLPFTNVCSNVESVAFSREEFASIEAKFEFLLLENGFKPRVSLPRPRFGNICIADNSNGYVVSPGGLLFRCWNEAAMSAEEASALLDNKGDLTANEKQLLNDSKWKNYDPFSHEMCSNCKVQPLCNGGCPWEADKKPVEGTGHCTTLKFNLPDKLRLYHLMKIIDKHPIESNWLTSDCD